MTSEQAWRFLETSVCRIDIHASHMTVFYPVCVVMSKHSDRGMRVIECVVQIKERAK